MQSALHSADPIFHVHTGDKLLHECVFLSFHVLYCLVGRCKLQTFCRASFLYVGLGWPCKKGAACHLSFKNFTVYRNIESQLGHYFKRYAIDVSEIHRSTRLFVCAVHSMFSCVVLLDKKFLFEESTLTKAAII
jgi:hypothetical protein